MFAMRNRYQIELVLNFDSSNTIITGVEKETFSDMIVIAHNYKNFDP